MDLTRSYINTLIACHALRPRESAYISPINDACDIAFYDPDDIGTPFKPAFRGSITRFTSYGLQSPCLRLTLLVTYKGPRLGNG
jgi:hypothetical protein